MCGIAGLFSPTGRPVDADIVRRMCALIAHRGPDDEGVWAEGPVGLGHKRLSIIDLSPRGRNPIAGEDGQVVLVANGEIYNHRELRAELEADGHRFSSDTDTEVIVHLIEDHADAAVDRLDGMFAFAAWNQRDGSLMLARDRFGVKPLYHARIGPYVAFASEIKALLAVPGFSAEVDPYGLIEHFTFQNMLGERTLFRGVSMLPAGEVITFSDSGSTTRRYWDLAFEPTSGLSPRDWAEGLRERFTASVRRQLMSDVPLGSYLSGGMDTGSITAVAAREIDRLHTFTCGFALPENRSDLEAYFDERSESHDLARHLGTLHHELELGPDAMIPALPSVVWHLDEPRVGISYQVYYTAEMIRRDVTVVLSGVGGDELFAGYPWRYAPIVAGRTGIYETAARLRRFEAGPSLFCDAVRSQVGDFTPADSVAAVLARCQTDDPLHRALYYDFKTFLNGLLVVDDKLSMAHSVEARVPFLDNELVDFARRIPAELRLDGDRGKVVLREAMAPLLPESTITRRKQGFTPPDRTWYKNESLDYIRRLLLDKRADRGYLDRAVVADILDEHLSDRANHRFLIWSLMCFEWWNRLFVDGDGPPPRPKYRGVAEVSDYTR